MDKLVPSTLPDSNVGRKPLALLQLFTMGTAHYGGLRCGRAYGMIDDWKQLKQRYTLPVIVEEARKVRWMEPTALAFISCVGNVPEESFRCYAMRQSNPAPSPY